MDAIDPKYPTDLDDEQWTLVAAVIPPPKRLGRERIMSMRAVVNAILYRRRTRCSWRMLPRDFPHWRTVYDYHRQWLCDGTWQRICQVLTRSGRDQLRPEESRFERSSCSLAPERESHCDAHACLPRASATSGAKA